MGGGTRGGRKDGENSGIPADRSHGLADGRRNGSTSLFLFKPIVRQGDVMICNHLRWGRRRLRARGFVGAPTSLRCLAVPGLPPWRTRHGRSGTGYDDKSSCSPTLPRYDCGRMGHPRFCGESKGGPPAQWNKITAALSEPHRRRRPQIEVLS